MDATIKKRKRVKHTRFPNGFGSIVFLKGNRRKPYCARKTKGFNEKGYPQYLVVGYYETFEDAFVALSEFNHIPYQPDKQKFIEVADKWYEEFEAGQAETTLQNYRASRKKCEPIHKKKIKDITSAELQAIVSEQTAGTQAEVIKYLHQVFHYALQKDIIGKDPTMYLKKTGKTETKRNPFTAKEVRAIWDMEDTPLKRAVLVMLYTGVRIGDLYAISEVHENYIITGSKTEAGKNRIIPIHSKIRPFSDIFEHPYYTTKGSLANAFRRKFPGHSPHDTRRAFISRCVECGIDGTVARKITGHKGQDVHEISYTFLQDPEFLCGEIEKLCY